MKTTYTREEEAAKNLALAKLQSAHPGKRFTLREIAKVSGLTPEAIRITERTALRKLRIRLVAELKEIR